MGIFDLDDLKHIKHVHLKGLLYNHREKQNKTKQTTTKKKTSHNHRVILHSSV